MHGYTISAMLSWHIFKEQKFKVVLEKSRGVVPLTPHMLVKVKLRKTKLRCIRLGTNSK